MEESSGFTGLVDVDALVRWMDGHSLGAGPITEMKLLTGGTQNILVRFARAGEAYLLRRPPRHKRPNSDETMRREARVLAALDGSAVPHPRLIALCGDEDVLGAAFYLMEVVEGFNAFDHVPEAFVGDVGAHVVFGKGMAATAAAIGQLDIHERGLADLAPGDTWLQRQLPQWRRQLERYSLVPGYDVDKLGRHDEVAAWLAENQPATGRVGLIHGDFHVANALVSPRTGAVNAVVDWELATIGDPFIDLATLLVSWPDPTLPVPSSLRTPLAGLPSRQALIAEYATWTGFDMSDFPWFQVLACYRVAVILDGTRARALEGRASESMGRTLHAASKMLISQATQLIGRGI